MITEDQANTLRELISKHVIMDRRLNIVSDKTMGFNFRDIHDARINSTRARKNMYAFIKTLEVENAEEER